MTLEQEYLNMSKKQKIMLQKTYDRGSKFNAGFTLAAIYWKESQAGLYRINVYDPSCGAFHNNLNSVFARHDYKNTKFKKNIICQKLIDSYDFSLAEATAEIEYWKEVHENNWYLIWSSYNAGWNTKAGAKYANDIKAKILVLKKYIKVNNGI